MPYPQISGGYLEYDTSGFPIVGGRTDTVIDDFEDQSLSEYGDAAGWQIQGTNVLMGRYSLEAIDPYVDLGDRGNDLPTPREDPPVEYRCHMLQEGAGAAAFMVNVQEQTDAWRNAYSVLVDTANQRIGVCRHESGTVHVLDSVSGTTHPQTGTEYIAAITTSSEAIKASLYDRSGTLLLETNSIADQIHTGGGLGWDNWDGAPVYFDHATRGAGSHGDIQELRTWLEDFESGSLDPYTSVKGSGTASTTPAAAYRGDYGLEMVDGQDLQTAPGSGLDNYLRAGHEILIRVNFQKKQSSTGTYQQYWFPFCMQSVTSPSNRYRMEFLMNGGFRIRKTKDGSASTLTGTSSEGRDYAALYNVDHPADSWLSAVLLVNGDKGVYAELHDAANNIKGWVKGDDTEFITATSENGFGFRSSGSGHVYWDHVFEIDQQYLDTVGRTEPIPHSDAPWSL